MHVSAHFTIANAASVNTRLHCHHSTVMMRILLHKNALLFDEHAVHISMHGNMLVCVYIYIALTSWRDRIAAAANCALSLCLLLLLDDGIS